MSVKRMNRRNTMGDAEGQFGRPQTKRQIEGGHWKLLQEEAQPMIPTDSEMIGILFRWRTSLQD